MTRISSIAIGLALQFIALAALADSPEVALRGMIECDVAGDPSARVAMAAATASVVVHSNRQADRTRIAFELDADALEVATEWHFEDGQRKCSSKECSIVVIYRVVATTAGSGVPSWGNVRGREIQPLANPTERSVKYQLRRIGDQWKIDGFPPPYVTPNVLTKFFVGELEKARSISLPANADARAIRGQEIIKTWRERQIEILAGVTP